MSENKDQNEKTKIGTGLRALVAFFTGISAFSLISWFEKIEGHTQIWGALARSTGLAAISYIPILYLVIAPLVLGGLIGWKATADSRPKDDNAMLTLAGLIILAAVAVQVFFE